MVQSMDGLMVEWRHSTESSEVSTVYSATEDIEMKDSCSQFQKNSQVG